MWDLTPGWLHLRCGPVFTLTSSSKFPGEWIYNSPGYRSWIGFADTLGVLFLYLCYEQKNAHKPLQGRVWCIKTKRGKKNPLWCPAFCRAISAKQLAENTLFVGDFGVLFLELEASLSFQYDHMQYSCGNWCCMGFSSNLYVARLHFHRKEKSSEKIPSSLNGQYIYMVLFVNKP